MKKIVFCILFGFISLSGFKTSAQEYKIKVEITGVEDTTVQLGYYYEDKQYVLQTERTDKKGVVTFKGDKPLPGGLYLVITPFKKHFDILIGDDQLFSVKTDTADVIKNMNIIGSDENSIFYKYQNHVIGQLKLSQQLRAEKSSKGDNVDTVAIQKNIDAINDDLNNYWKEIVSDNPGTFLASLLNASNGAERQGGGDSHYFDNINFGDEGLLRTPFIHRTARLVLARNLNAHRSTDVIISEIDKLVTAAKANKMIYQYVLNHCLNFFRTFQRDGMNEVFVHIAENYFLDGKADWMNENIIKEIEKVNDLMRGCLVGEIAPDIEMETFAGDMISLHQIDTKYILIFFWSSGCGHCADAADKMSEMYETDDNQNIEVFAVYPKTDRKKWTEFMEEHKMENYINVFDPEAKSNYKSLYYVVSTPIAYLLDADKKIISKRVGDSLISDLVDQLMKQ